MTGKDALRTQFQLFYLTANANLEGVSEEDSLVQPTPGGNCANWIVGHILGAHNGVARLLGESPVWESDQLERATTDPITSADEAIDWTTMVDALLRSEDRLLGALDALPAEDLDDPGFTDPFGNQTTRGGFLGLLAMHQNYHAGQLGMSRRLAGLPGAVRSPEQVSAEP
jgi:uncharacterized damage-inducible protein DinB